MDEQIISRIEEIHHGLDTDARLFIKREDEIHPFISGNKYRKLKYNLIQAKRENHDTLLTFGGAFSNHISAVAFAGKEQGFKTIGVIRGEELQTKIESNPTLRFAQDCGMQFHFVSREDYRKKEEQGFIKTLKLKFGNFYLIPEGGTNHLAVKGCSELLNAGDADFDYICCSVGTAGTISGIINASLDHQTVIGFSALKGDFLREDIRKFASKNKWHLNTDFHFGGYARVSDGLVDFINQFKLKMNISLDPIYTGKLVYGVMELLEQGYFKPKSKILMIHTGGLQGIKGMNVVLNKKGKTLITV
ncbi:pyridoxal-phosphate dependent enzyme [Winogradskyella maritima]|uniref:1-aminocyclopropane-1-carboxylate deaminase/D-cysteine desulfhydrase n=1 Tax=Winogradskyella maritima TaxID=1517766 RepID=A0ABV8AJI7_9FLAO|nr:pyridoxal-phosphate dependent enzyme [Winogradskyella maritima]